VPNIHSSMGRRAICRLPKVSFLPERLAGCGGRNRRAGAESFLPRIDAR
jgi:hypothetical protein